MPRFPVLTFLKSGSEFYLFQRFRDFVVYPKQAILYTNKSKVKTLFIDSDGIQFRLNNVEPIGYSSFFFGISIRFVFKPTYYVKATVIIEDSLSVEELKEVCYIALKKDRTFMNMGIKKKAIKDEVNATNDREILLRYLFYIGSPTQYLHPSEFDPDWRNRYGFIKKKN